MIVVDANVLLYAYISQFPQHAKTAEWLENTLSEGKDSIGITWHVATAFLRLSTNHRVFDQPFSIDFVISRLEMLFAHPLVEAVTPTDRHWTIFSDLLRELGLAGNIVSDAHIAAVAIEHNAALATSDKDFRRFSDHLKIFDPMAK